MSNKYDSDYRPSAGGCGYPSLGCYNPQSAASGQALPPTGKQIIPTYDAPGYNTLQHGAKNPSCGGHFSYMNAYSHAQGCNQNYTTRVCGGCNQ